MGEITEIIKDLNLPKQLLDKGEELLKTFFGPSVKEISETFADNFRLRRFKNQVDILTKAMKYVNEKGIEPKNINLKILVPLVQYSSLEEDENLQERWAKLITNIVKTDNNDKIKQMSVEIISKITNQEAIIMDLLYNSFEEKKRKSLEVHNKINKTEIKINDYNFPLSYRKFGVWEIKPATKLNSKKFELIIQELIDLRLIKRDKKAEIKRAEIDKSDYEEQLDIEIDVVNSDLIELTNLGYNFMKMCNT